MPNETYPPSAETLEILRNIRCEITAICVTGIGIRVLFGGTRYARRRGPGQNPRHRQPWERGGK